jgi:hypothetical protein
VAAGGVVACVCINMSVIKEDAVNEEGWKKDEEM